jgi:hypothetical protein
VTARAHGSTEPKAKVASQNAARLLGRSEPLEPFLDALADHLSHWIA